MRNDKTFTKQVSYIDLLADPFVPYTNRRYRLSSVGNIYDSETGKEIKKEIINGEYYVEIDWIFGKKFYNLAVIFIVSYRPNLRLPSTHFDKIIPLYKDSNKLNVISSNLTYKFIPNLIEIDHPFASGFYYIPEFTNNGIDRDGQLLSLHKNTIFDPKTSSGIHTQTDYAVWFAISDFGNSIKIGIHRLIALTFIDYDENYLNMVVNHIDGNKRNNDIQNLEWVSYSRNIEHAYETGLRNTIQGVETKNFITKEVKYWYSIQEACRQFNTSKHYIKKSIKRGFMKLSEKPEDSYYIRYENKPWKNIKEEVVKNEKEKWKAEKVAIKAYNVLTSQVFLFDSIMQACKELGNIKPKSVREHIKSDSMVPSKGYIFRFMTDNRPFPIYTSDQLEIIKYNLEKERHKFAKNISWGYRVTDIETNQTTMYFEMDDISQLVKMHRVEIYKALRNPEKTAIVKKRWKITKITLEGKYPESTTA